MTEALKTGTFAFRIGMLPKDSIHTIIDNTNPDKPTEKKFESKVSDFPYAKYVDIFNIYPDPHSGPLQYVTERYITTTEDAIETFNAMIESTNNKSPLKDIVKYLNLNQGKADFTDNASIRYQIPQDIADEFRRTDYFMRQKTQQTLATTTA